MILLVSGATKTLREIQSPNLGYLFVPAAVDNPDTALTLCQGPWAADNGGFKGFKQRQFFKMLDKLAQRPGCLFVTAPDIVGSHIRTQALFKEWEPLIHSLNLPVAFVLQDGAWIDDVPWQSCEAVFVGGSTDFKLSHQARLIVETAKSRGKHVHMGRVNTRTRIRYAASIGCDSFDGSGFSKWPDARIPLALKWIKEILPPAK